MRKNVYVVMLVGLMGFTACGNRNTTKAVEAEAETIVETLTNLVTPADCKGEDGFVWSEMEKNCIRVFERGIAMLDLKNQDMDHIAYVVFNADSTQAELFMPGAEKTEILDRRALPNGGYAWNIEDDDTKNVRRIDGVWTISQRGEVIYKHTKELEPIQARYQGSDGITRRLYWVDATFYPDASRVTLKIDDKTYELKQYVTGSGYGYRNDEIDLRGKGVEATLTYADKEIRDLVLKQVKE